MKKIIGSLIVMALLPVALMVGCNGSIPSSPKSSGGMTPTQTVTSTPRLTPTITPTNLNGYTSTPTITSTPQTAQAPLTLNTAGNYSVMAASKITDAGEILCGDIGEFPGSTITGVVYTFAATCSSSVANIGTAPASIAQAALTLAYNDARGRLNAVPIPTVAVGDMGGQAIPPGLYYSGSTIGITGAVTLDGNGVTNPVFIFQIGSGLTTATGSQVVLKGTATAANVYWQVGSSTTLGPSSSLVGTILAYTSITLNTGATLNGQALAMGGGAVGGAVVFDGSNTVIAP